MTFFEKIYTYFTDIIKYIGDMVSWLNPTSEDFFLKVAFIPADGYFEEYANKYDTLVKTKFAFFFQLKDTMDAMTTSLQSNTVGFQGFKIDLSKYGIGEQTIVSPQAINEYGEKMKYWIGGMMYFFTGMFLFRRLSSVLGSGK